MARTLNELLKKRRDARSSSASNQTKKLSEVKKRKSTLERWMEPMLKKSKTISSPIIIVDTSDEESDREQKQQQKQKQERQDHKKQHHQQRDQKKANQYNHASKVPLARRTHVEDRNAHPEDNHNDDNDSDNIYDDDSGEYDASRSQKKRSTMARTNQKKNQQRKHNNDTIMLEPESAGDEAIQPTTTKKSISRNSLKKRNKNDKLFTGTEGQKRCRALSLEGFSCSNASVPDTWYCHFHADHEISSEAATAAAKEGATKSRTKRRTNRSFRGMLGERRCLAKSGLRCKPCEYCAVIGSLFCHHHENHNTIGKLLDSSSSDSDSDTDSDSGSGDHRTQVKDRWFREGSSERRCLAVTKRNLPCKHVARDRSFYCLRHADLHLPLHEEEFDRNNGRIGDNSGDNVKNKDKDGDDESGATKNLSDADEIQDGDSSDEFEDDAHADDDIFVGRDGQTRCLAITQNGRPCRYASFNGSVCHGHFAALSQLQSQATLNILARRADEDSDWDDVYGDNGNDDTPRPYRQIEFIKMWSDCEEYCGEVTDEIESSRRVRGANSKMAPEDSMSQAKAQYGRLLPFAMKILMRDVFQLKKDGVFLDIGHGIGNTCLQAAYTIGCEARGIEVVFDRNSVARVFRDYLSVQHENNPNKNRFVGQVTLKHGRLEDAEHHEFLTKGVTAAFVNNFNGVFAERSSKGNQKWYLDDYVAGIFASMQPGAILVSLHPLSLGPTKKEANDTRTRQGLATSENASFYAFEKLLLGKACDTVKWNQRSGNQKNMYIYKYTRLEQPDGENGAVFLCCNPACQIAKDERPIPATCKNEEGKYVINHCECKFTAKNLRRQRRKVYSHY